MKNNRFGFFKSRRLKLLLFAVSICAVLTWAFLRADATETIDLGYVPYTAAITQQYSVQSPVLRTLQGWLLHKPQSRQIKIVWKSSQQSTFQCQLTYNRTTQKLYHQFSPPATSRYTWRLNRRFPFLHRWQTFGSGWTGSSELTISENKLKQVLSSNFPTPKTRSSHGRIYGMLDLISKGPFLRS